MCNIKSYIFSLKITDDRPPVSPTLSPERLTLLLQGQTHACVAVGLPACTGGAVYQIEISWTRFCSAITVFWKVTGSRRGSTQHARALQLHRERQWTENSVTNSRKIWCQSRSNIITAKWMQFCHILSTLWCYIKGEWYILIQCPNNYLWQSEQ